MNAKKIAAGQSPLIRFRQMVLVMAGIAVLLAGPLLLVWKQTYIRGASVRLGAMADTLSMLENEMARLRLASERLSSLERIETFARTSLNLDYPSSDRMMIISMEHSAGDRSEKRKTGVLLASVRLSDRITKGGRR